MEETGPVFLDEDLGGGSAGQVPAARSAESLPEVRPRGEIAPAGSIDWDDPGRLHGQRPESASAWQADVSRQTGFAGQSEERVSWGLGEGGGGAAADEGASASDPRGGWGRGAEEGRTGSAAGAQAAAGSGPYAGPEAAQSPPAEGTFQMRAMSPEALRRAAQEGGGAGGAQQPEYTVGLRRSDVVMPGQDRPGPAQSAPVVPGQSSPAQTPAQPQPQPQPPAQPQPQTPAQPQAQTPPPAQQAPAPSQVPPAQAGFGPNAPAQASVPAPPAVPQQGAPREPESPQPPSWAQQVQDLAGRAPGGGPDAHGAPPPGGPLGQQGAGPDSVTPWRPPVSDPFLQAAQQEARPAGLGKRLGARIVDGVLTSAVAAGVTFPFAGQAVDHIEQKMEAVRQTGETKQVWLIDGTTGGYLALVLGALFVFGLLYEVLPTSRWGRTLGKKMFGLKVLTMEQQERPGFGSAFMRWLVHGVLSVVVIGVLNVLWCVFDRPWRQCWHDKLAGTFVSKDAGEVRL